MAITTYGTAMTGALAGQLAGDGVTDVRSYVNAEASDELPFGKAAVQGTLERDALVPDDDAQKVVGIVAYSQVYSADDLGAIGIKADRELNILNKGRIWVLSATACAVGDRGYVHYAGSYPGCIGNANTTDVAFDTSAQIKILSACAAHSQLILVECDFQAVQGASSVTSSG